MTENERAVEALTDALNRGDLVAAYSSFAEDCLHRSARGEVRGRDAMVAADAAIFGQLADHSRRIDSMLSDGDAIVAWLTWRGSVEATGKSFECPVCNIFHFAGGKVVAWETYGDFTSVVAAFSS